jgi:hypothetical protein
MNKKFTCTGRVRGDAYNDTMTVINDGVQVLDNILDPLKDKKVKVTVELLE